MLFKKKPSAGPRPSVLYELRSVNLANLPEKEQGSVLDRFASFLDSLTEPITFHIFQDEREVEAIGALYQIPYKRFFLETHSQVDSLVQKLGTRMVRVHALPQIKSAKVNPRYIIDSEGHYVQTYCITQAGRHPRSGLPGGTLPDSILPHAGHRADRHLRGQEDGQVVRPFGRFEAHPEAERRKVPRPGGAGGVPEGFRGGPADRGGQGEAVQDSHPDRPA